jgi:hypothetical protein
MNYIDITNIEDRKKKANILLLKYKECIPVIIEKSKSEKILPPMDKFKYIINRTNTISFVLKILRDKLQITEATSIYIMTGNKTKYILSGSQSIDYVYNTYKNEDGFLYLEYCSENVFG